MTAAPGAAMAGARQDAGATLAAAGATTLGAGALTPVFTAGDWFPPVLAAVVVVAVAGLLLRLTGPLLWSAARGGRPVPPRWAALGVPLVPIGQLLALGCLATALFAPTRAVGGWLPTAASVADLARVLADGSTQIREQVTPAVPLTGLTALTALMVGVVAITVDLVAVGGRQPAVAALGLLVVFCVPLSTVTGSVGLAAVTLPACGLVLLLWADQHRRLAWRPRAGRRPRMAAGALTALRIGVLALAAGLVLGTFVPTLREGQVADHWRAGGGGGSTGTSLDPVASLQGQLTREDPVDLLRLEASVPDPGYLRAVALEVYDAGSGWTLGELDGEASLADGGELAPLPGRRAGRVVQAGVTVLGHDDQFLPLLYSPLSVAIADAGEWRFDRSAVVAFGRARTTDGHVYRQVAAQPQPTLEELAGAAALPPGSPLERYAALPALPASVTELVGSLTAGATTPHQRVQAIYGFLTDPANGWVYSLSTEPGTSGDDLADFLDARRGYCEQYAGAMAVMVRAAGVPARVALGYTPGLVQEDGSRLITSNDAHAWVEVYFDDLGWVPYDPTPIDQDRAVALPWAPRPQDLEVDPRTDLPVAPVPAPAPTSAPVDRAAGGAPAVQAGNGSDDVPGTLLRIAGVLGGVAAVLGLPAGLRTLQRRRRLAEGSAAALWDELAATACDLGLPWHRTSTPRQVAEQLVGSLPGRGAPGRGAHRLHGSPVVHAGDAVARLARAEEAASYARPGSGPDPAELPRLLLTARRGLLAAAPARTRARALLWPASVPATLARGPAGRWLRRLRTRPV